MQQTKPMTAIEKVESYKFVKKNIESSFREKKMDYLLMMDQ